jgi:hypothetical protein
MPLLATLPATLPLASLYVIGGSTAGLILLIVVIVLLVRR